jgi:hypothetical protein
MLTLTIVVSWPPCGVPGLVNNEQTLFTSATCPERAHHDEELLWLRGGLAVAGERAVHDGSGPRG